jgi:hypothetical protein
MASALILVTAADLIWRHSGSPLSAMPIGEITAYRPDGAALAERIRAELGSGDERGRVEIFGLGGSWQNAALAYRLEQTLGYEPVRWADYESATGSFQNNHLPERRLTGQFTGYDSPLARALGIRVVASGAPIETILPAAAIRSLRPLGRLGEAYLYRNESVLPRVTVMPLETDSAPEPEPIEPSDNDPPPIGSAEILSYRQSQVIVSAQLVQPGLLVLHDLYHPAWRVTVDGQPAELRRTELLFRAVALPAGEHRIIFSFEPLSRRSLMEAAGRVITAYASDAP